jgi:hypothetical protein
MFVDDRRRKHDWQAIRIAYEAGKTVVGSAGAGFTIH